jgi:hypothetical protein
MFNRIDRVVPFVPLDEGTIRRIATRELSLIAERDGVRLRELSLNVSEAAAARLAEAGYDVLYGARPLKRAIERDLLAPLADAVNQYGDKLKLSADVDVQADRVAVSVRALSPSAAAAQPPSMAPAAGRAAALRRRAQAIARSPAVLDLQNNLYQLRRLVQRKSAHPGRRLNDPASRERIRRLTAISDAVGKLDEDATRLEDELLLHVYESAALSMSREGIQAELGRLDAAAELALLNLYSLRFENPHRMTVALYGESHGDVFDLARAYYAIARGLGETEVGEAPGVGVSWFSRQGKHTLQRNFVEEKDVEKFLDSPRGGVIGLVLDLRGAFAAARFEGETGLHVFEEEKDRNSRGVLVEASVLPLGEYAPPKDVEFRSATVGQRRRTYLGKQQRIEDRGLRREYRWLSRPFEEALGAAMEEGLMGRTGALLR